MSFIGGRRPEPRPEDVEEWRELVTRWFQFGTFCPLLRVHGQFPNREMWFFDEGHRAYETQLAFAQGAPLDGDRLFLTEPEIRVDPSEIAVSKRIGIGNTGDAAHWPLRFYINGSRYVSAHRYAR